MTWPFFDTMDLCNLYFVLASRSPTDNTMIFDNCKQKRESKNGYSESMLLCLFPFSFLMRYADQRYSVLEGSGMLLRWRELLLWMVSC